MRWEPNQFVFLAFIEDELEGAEGEGDEAEAEQIEADAALLVALDLGGDPGWIFDDALGEKERKDADGDVEVEDPAPVEVIGDVAAEGGADGGRDDDGEAVHGKGLASLFWGEGVGEDGLLGRREAAAADALQDAAEDQQRKGGGDAAKRGADAEQGHADHVELFAADKCGHVGAGGKDDGVGDQIRGEDPGGFVLGGAEAAGDVREGDVGDGAVEDPP